MAIYLVMKNNLKRLFCNKVTYIVLLVVPLLIAASGIISTKFTQDIIRIGIENPNDNIMDIINSFDHIQYEIIHSKSINTDCIMGTYDYIINSKNSDETDPTISKIQNEQQKLINKKQLSVFERQFAMLMTAYLVIATMYATKFISDKAQGLTERFCLSGRKCISYACGYILSTLVIVFIQVSIAVLCFCMLEQELQITFEKAILITLSISSISTIYGVIISFISKRDLTANITAAVFAVLASIVGGTFVVVEEMPKVLQIISLLSPVRWILNIF